MQVTSAHSYSASIHTSFIHGRHSWQWQFSECRPQDLGIKPSSFGFWTTPFNSWATVIFSIGRFHKVLETDTNFPICVTSNRLKTLSDQHKMMVLSLFLGSLANQHVALGPSNQMNLFQSSVGTKGLGNETHVRLYWEMLVRVCPRDLLTKIKKIEIFLNSRSKSVYFCLSVLPSRENRSQKQRWREQAVLLW